MKKYAYKMIMRNNDKTWQGLGLQSGGMFGSSNREPVDITFANRLGQEGYEMFQVVQYGTESAYYFRKEL